jgi:hypothetical protein
MRTAKAVRGGARARSVGDELSVRAKERGNGLAEVAARFEAAGVAERSRALLSLERCKPGRPPAYRKGDPYHLDPHDGELDLYLARESRLVTATQRDNSMALAQMLGYRLQGAPSGKSGVVASWSR